MGIAKPVIGRRFAPTRWLHPSYRGVDQPRVRERIMKLSKVYSATCHHRYWSER
jgi:hypothetical protein